MTNGYRQEVFNVLLAQLLQERGVITAPENIIQLGVEQKRRMPDVIVSFYGLRMAIEGEIAKQRDAQERALKSASKRVEEGIAHIGVAVIYPKQLRKVGFGHLKAELMNSELNIAIVTESESTGFVKGNVDYLEVTLRHVFEQLVREDVVVRAVAIINAGIENFAKVVMTKSGIVNRIAETLGIKELPKENTATEEEEEESE